MSIYGFLTMSVIVFTIILTMSHVWASQPVVYKSVSTGEIVKIDGSDTMPDKYELVWVK